MDADLQLCGTTSTDCPVCGKLFWHGTPAHWHGTPASDGQASDGALSATGAAALVWAEQGVQFVTVGQSPVWALDLNLTIALITLGGVVLTGWLAYCQAIAQSRSDESMQDAQARMRRAEKQIEEINDAVNHRHEKSGQKLYDLVFSLVSQTQELLNWKRGYSPGPLDDGEKVRNFVNRTHSHFRRVDDRLKAIDQRISGLPCDQTCIEDKDDNGA